MNRLIDASTRPPSKPAGKAARPFVEPYANHGRWVIDCPALDCNGASLADRGDPWFFCASCGNREHANLMLPVRWHRDSDLVEAVLVKRPLAQNRNWRPPETVAQLIDENRRHGLGG